MATRLLFVLLMLPLSACGGSSSPSAPSTAGSTPGSITKSYVGVLALQARPGRSGRLQLTTTYAPLLADEAGSLGTRVVVRIMAMLNAALEAQSQTASGTITTPNSGSVNLAGSYNTSTSTFTVSGGGFQITADATDTTMTGTGTHVAESGLPAGVVGRPVTPTTTAETWCGTFASTYNGGLPFQTHGQFQFVATPKADGSSGYDVSGQSYNDTDATHGVFVGSLSYSGGGSGSLSLQVTNHDAGASGTYNGSSWSGTYEGGVPRGNERGNWQATRCP